MKKLAIALSLLLTLGSPIVAYADDAPACVSEVSLVKAIADQGMSYEKYDYSVYAEATSKALHAGLSEIAGDAIYVVHVNPESVVLVEIKDGCVVQEAPVDAAINDAIVAAMPKAD